MDNEYTFGYSYWGTPFREILRLSPTGLLFKRTRSISWSEIVAYRASPDFAFDLVLAFLSSAKPRLWLYLRNGEVLRVRGDVLVREPLSSTYDAAEHAAAFADLVRQLNHRGLSTWKGPRDEMVLLITGLALFVCGAAAGARIAHVFSTSIAIGGGTVIGGVMIAQLAFLAAPLIARRTRRIYIQSTDLSKAPPATER